MTCILDILFSTFLFQGLETDRFFMAFSYSHTDYNLYIKNKEFDRFEVKM